MNSIVQPITVTEMRRDPKSLLKRVKKEGMVPVLVSSKFEAAFVSIEELERMQEMIKELKHELFVEETLGAIEDYKKNGGRGPFNSVEKFMADVDKYLEAEE